ncbi:MAG: DUF4838 domain-containing protein [Armatimonadia bacterium]
MARATRLWLLALLAAVPLAASAKEYALVSAGKPTSCIVMADEAAPTMRHAAEELATFLEKVSGARVPIANTATKGLFPIYLCTAQEDRVVKSPVLQKALRQLRDDGFIIAVSDTGLQLVSKEPVGVLFGTYDVLKRYAGMRWFYPGPDGEYCPHKATIKVPGQLSVSNPSFRYRDISFVCANVNSLTTDTWDWMVRNGMPIHVSKHVYPQVKAEVDKRGVHTEDGGHCFAYLLSDKLIDEHPEYFGLFDGKRIPQQGRYQPCTSNPRVADIMAEGIMKVLDNAPEGGRYLIGNNDATDWCHCDECTRLDPPDEKKKGIISTRYCTFVNEIAARVYASHPDANLWAWAYQNYQMPPTGVTLDKRLSLEACVHHRCYRHSLDDEKCLANARFRDMLSSWCKLGHVVTAREYNEVFPGDPPYVPYERVYCRDLRYYHKLGMAGFRLPIAPPDGKFGPVWNNRQTLHSWYAQWPSVYLAALTGWDINTDYDKAVEDMGSRYYGPAWPAMKQYRELLVRLYEETPGDIIYGAGGLGTCLEWPNSQARLESLLAQADKAAAGDPLILRRIQRDRDYLTWGWVEAHEKYLATRPRETHAARRTGPLAIDGKLDDADWKQAEITTNFIANDGPVANPQTYVKVLYDDSNLYFAVEAMEPAPAQLKAQCAQRDEVTLFRDSTVEFFLVAPGMNGRYCQIAVNPRGTVYDALNASATSADLAFDAGAEVKTALLADRWIVEARVPTAALGRTIRDGETWKVNVGRSRKLNDDTPSQASSWSNGSFHGLDAYRPLVFGGTPLINNGDFEDTVKAPESMKQAGWQFADDLAPARWSFTEKGTASVVTGDAASGKRFYRGRGWIFQLIAIPADFRGNLRLQLKARGTGSLWVSTFQYDRKTNKHTGTVVLKDLKLDAPQWTAVEASQPCTDDRILRLALRLDGQMEIDDVCVTPEEGPAAQ